jgi:hypothetical protein
MYRPESKRVKKGRDIAQTVSRWLPSAVVRVCVGADYVGFVVDKVALRHVFFEYFDFPCETSFHQFLHHHNHRGWHSRHISGRSAEWTQLVSTPHYSN